MITKNYPVFADTAYLRNTTITNNSITDITDVDSQRDMRIDDILIVNLDATSRTVNIFINNGTTDFLLTTATLSSSAGNSPTVGLLSIKGGALTSFAFPSSGLGGGRFIFLPKGFKLRAKIDSTTNGYTVHVFGAKYPIVT